MAARRKSKGGRGPWGLLLPLLLGVAIGIAVWMGFGDRLLSLLPPREGPPATPTPAARAPRPAPTPTRRPAPPAPRQPTRTAPPADFEPAEPRGGGVLALVLDDLGWDESALRRLESFQVPLALSVIPRAPKAAASAALATRKGWDLLVHLPMTPQSARGEEDAIGPGDDDAVIASRVEEALRRVPGAIGLNNHQGSEATESVRVVRAMLGVVRDRGLFFLDSRTTPRTVAEREARAMGVPALSRDVFLDDAEESASEGASEVLDAAFRKVREVIAKKGFCIAIGHPHRSTLDRVRQELPALGRDRIRLVRISELAE